MSLQSLAWLGLFMHLLACTQQWQYSVHAAEMPMPVTQHPPHQDNLMRMEAWTPLTS